MSYVRFASVYREFKDIDQDLLFVLDERGHSVHLTDSGVDFLSPNSHDQFVLPDISIETHRVEHDTSLTPEQRLEATIHPTAEKGPSRKFRRSKEA